MKKKKMNEKKEGKKINCTDDPRIKSTENNYNIDEYMIYDICDRLSSDYKETDTEKQEFLDVSENYDSFIARAKTKEEHRAEVIKYLKNNPNRDLNKITIHNFYQKEKIDKRRKKIQYVWWANITCEKNSSKI